MADNNEKLERDLQNQEADIEVDVTKDVAEEAGKQPEEHQRGYSAGCFYLCYRRFRKRKKLSCK